MCILTGSCVDKLFLPYLLYFFTAHSDVIVGMIFLPHTSIVLRLSMLFSSCLSLFISPKELLFHFPAVLRVFQIGCVSGVNCLIVMDLFLPPYFHDLEVVIEMEYDDYPVFR